MGLFHPVFTCNKERFVFVATQCLMKRDLDETDHENYLDILTSIVTVPIYAMYL